MSVQNGTAIVKPGDIVQKGDILVNGFLEGLYTGTRYVHGSATIEAKTWYTKKEKQPLKQEIKVETGNEEKKYGIKFKKNQINLFKTLSKFEKYDTIYATKKLKLFSNFYIPVELIECNNSEIKEYEINYSEEEAKEEAKRRAEEKLNQKITNKDNINNVTVNYTIKDDAVEAEVTYEVFENIGTNEKIVF